MHDGHGKRRVIAAAACSLLAVSALGCSVLDGKGGQAPVLAQGNTLAEAVGGAATAPGSREHPRVTALAPQPGTPGVIDPLRPAMDGQEQPLVGGSVNLAAEGVELASTGGMSWVLYCVAPAAGSAPDTLQLEFASRDGVVWVALPDFTNSRWDWVQLDAGLQVQLEFDPALRLKDDATYITLAVHGGATAVFHGGALYSLAAGPPEDGVEIQPADKLPDMVGAYLSLGYWDSAAVDNTLAELAQLGVNLVLDYALIPPEDDTWRAAFQHYLDTAQEHGIGIAFYLAPQLYGTTPESAEEQMQDVLAVVQQLQDQPAITAWYVHDEVLPDVENDWGNGRYAMSLPQMQHLYSQIRAVDPQRPQLSVWCYLPGFTEFRDAYVQFASWGETPWMQDQAAYEGAMADLLQTTCDWVMIDSYPVGAPWGGGSPVAEVAALTARAAELKSPTQPLVFVFQAFSWEQYDPQGAAGAPFPTRDEMQAMLCAAHLLGATGTVAYSWFDLTGSAPNQEIAGRDTALADARLVLAGLAKSGWPELTLPLQDIRLSGTPDKQASAQALQRHSQPRPSPRRQ